MKEIKSVSDAVKAKSFFISPPEYVNPNTWFFCRVTKPQVFLKYCRAKSLTFNQYNCQGRLVCQMQRNGHVWIAPYGNFLNRALIPTTLAAKVLKPEWAIKRVSKGILSFLRTNESRYLEVKNGRLNYWQWVPFEISTYATMLEKGK